MLLSEQVTMDNNSSALLPSLVFGHTKFINHIVILELGVANDIYFVSNGSCSRRLITSYHDDLNASLFTGQDRLINAGTRGIVQ